MAYLSLYRKFRPRTFDEVVGQKQIVKILKNQIMDGAINHAYLFTGARGIGKTSLAKIFARAVNCQSPVDGSPCFKCEMCQSLSANDVDIVEIDGASNNRVDEVRELIDKVSFSPTIAKYKVYIIDEVHMLTESAFNALLKTLEEPPSYVIFILATTEIQKIPQTILSRCMRFDFRLFSISDISSHVKTLAKNLGREVTDEGAVEIAKAGEGSMRDALSLADQCLSLGEKVVTGEMVRSVLGSARKEVLEELALNIFHGELGKAFSLIDTILSDGKSLLTLSKNLQELIRETLTLKLGGKTNYLDENRLTQLKDLSGSASKELMSTLLETLAENELKFRFTQNPRILFEVGILKCLKLSNQEDVFKRLEDFEKRLETLEQNAHCPRQ